MHRSQPLINFAWSLTTEQPVAIESPKLHTLVARGLSLRPLARLLSTLSRLLRQAEKCIGPTP
jgi:hypothetical protein